MNPAIRLQPLKLITIAALDWRNGLEYALEAVHRLAQGGLHVDYTIVGSGEFLEAVVLARHEFGLDDRVKLLLTADDARIQALLRDAHAFLYPCVAPGAAHGLAMAVAARRPVIAFEQAEVAAALQGYSDVQWIPRRDVERLTDALKSLLNFPETSD
ncbi:MAG: glycosyltransferase [Chloroflexi bacterium]|nr:glycosyltransferase [Chloroflexota bacterium]